MRTFLSVNEVTKKYANHLAINNLSLQVPENSIYGLLGPNGAGKTSLIRIINQITAPDKGSILLNGEVLSPEHISRIGYLPEERGLYKKMKVGEQALYLARLKGMPKNIARQKLLYWFEKFEIENWWNRKVEELSKGMQQKIQFIVTILHQPELLIFDEPFSGFDPINVNLLKEEILKLREQGATIIFSTHNMASVEELCDHIALINNGNKILEGTVNEIREAHRTHTFECEIKQPVDSIKQDLEQLSVTLNKFVRKADNSVRITITSDAESSGNQLIKKLLPLGELSDFKELLPSMNDIFIAQVSATNIKTDSHE
ncbi:MAG: ATP-binding cassette domain-containing protein [Bacteroidetes bacterium]|nr:ATP-binding cassette domain-containing protein [Bacteroidota bacterium]MBU1580173.1 ATP-binding cassette domain-containing protein [Bacteroidota bacterium]MBU2556188.1 ATP-binding cassette domain-containing protein [Bacteroidota bacterium]